MDKPCTHWYAAQISDPIERLRFLKQIERRTRVMRYAIRLTPLLLAVPASFLLIRAAGRVEPAPAAVRQPPPQVSPVQVSPVQVSPVQVSPAAPVPAVWQVEQIGNAETYSNGLRIDNRYSVAGRPRSYLAFPADSPQDSHGVQRSEPAGIVFHSSESQQAPFEAQQNRRLALIGQSLLDYVRQKGAYNFLIDRFGRVYRVVEETDTANHAGHSVWSDDKWIYINLNESFLGVSFEAQTPPGQLGAAINPVQARAAAMLTEMLRDRYGIPAGNCVTHGQVSVNPSNMRIGYHTDWASGFPFEQLGLPNNYVQPVPALSVFGFKYDPSSLPLGGSPMYAGVELAERNVHDAAVESGLSEPAYRRILRKRYREIIAGLPQQNVSEIRDMPTLPHD